MFFFNFVPESGSNVALWEEFGYMVWLILVASFCVKWNVFLQLCVCMWVPWELPGTMWRSEKSLVYPLTGDHLISQKCLSIECNVFLQPCAFMQVQWELYHVWFDGMSLSFCLKKSIQTKFIGFLMRTDQRTRCFNMNATFVLNFVFAWRCFGMYHVTLWGELGIWSDRMSPNLMVQEAKQISVFSIF